jgi:hypothetical protein
MKLVLQMLKYTVLGCAGLCFDDKGQHFGTTVKKMEALHAVCRRPVAA